MKATAKPIINVARMLIVALPLVFTAPQSMAAKSAIIEMDSGTSALVARERIKQSTNRRRNTAAAKRRGASSSECGRIDIGNSDDQSRTGRRTAPRKTVIIADGPIVNAANCR